MAIQNTSSVSLGSAIETVLTVEIVKVGRSWVGRRPSDRWNLETIGRKSWSDDQVKSREIGRSLAKDGIKLQQVKGKIEAGSVDFAFVDPTNHCPHCGRPNLIDHKSCVACATLLVPTPAPAWQDRGEFTHVTRDGAWISEDEYIDARWEQLRVADPIRQAIEEAMASLDFEAACGVCEAEANRLTRAFSDDVCLKCGAGVRPQADLCDWCEDEVSRYPINAPSGEFAAV